MPKGPRAGSRQFKTSRQGHGHPIPTRPGTRPVLDRCRALFANASDIFFVVHLATGQVLDANPRAEQLYGYTRAEFLEMNIARLRVQDPLEELMEPLQRAGKTEARSETTHRKKDGSLFPVEVSSHAIELEGEHAILSIVRDITVRKQAEQALRESEDRFHTLVEKAPEAIVISRSGWPVYANPPFLKMMGYADDRACRQVPLVENLAPSERAVLLERARRQSLGFPAQEHFDTQALRRDGSEFPVHVCLVQIRLSDGPAIVGFITDSSAQKQAQEAIHRQAAHARALAELTSWLSTSLNLDEMMASVCQALQTALGTPVCVYLADAGQQVLHPAFGQGIRDGLWRSLPPLPVGPGKGLADLAFSPAEQERFGFSGLTLHAMEYQGQRVGAIAIPAAIGSTSGAASLSPEEHALVDAFARHAAITTINLRLYQETRERANELEKLTEVSASLRQARSLGEMVPLLVDQTVQALGADTGALVLFPESFAGAPVDPVLLQVPPEWAALLDGADLSRSAGLPGSAGGPGLERQFSPSFSARAEDKTTAPFPALQWQASPIVCLSGAVVRSVESTTGLLLVGYFQPHGFLEEEQRLMLAIADMAGNAIHRTSIMDTLEQRVRVRTRELEVLYEIARASSQLTNLETILEQSLARIVEVYRVNFGLIQLLSDGGKMVDTVAQMGLPKEAIRQMARVPLAGSIIEQVVRENRTVLLLDLDIEMGLAFSEPEKRPRVYMGAPIRSKGEILGVISIAHHTPIRFSVEEVALLETIASQVEASVESARLRMRSEEVAIQEERQRLARDLHDSVTQSLFSLNMMAEGYRRSAAQATPQQISAWFAELGASGHQALKEMRLMLYALRPNTIELDGLVVALHRRLDAVEGRSGVKTSFHMQGDARQLDISEQIELYHIAQEALNNSLKHAQAASVAVSLSVAPGCVAMEIRDDGIGFVVEGRPTEGMGLASMAERAARTGGALEVRSRPGEGTQVSYRKEVSDDRADANPGGG
jgi:PAS domain S-box-containing protein